MTTKKVEAHVWTTPSGQRISCNDVAVLSWFRQSVNFRLNLGSGPILKTCPSGYKLTVKSDQLGRITDWPINLIDEVVAVEQSLQPLLPRLPGKWYRVLKEEDWVMFYSENGDPIGGLCFRRRETLHKSLRAVPLAIGQEIGLNDEEILAMVAVNDVPPDEQTLVQIRAISPRWKPKLEYTGFKFDVVDGNLIVGTLEQYGSATNFTIYKNIGSRKKPISGAVLFEGDFDMQVSNVSFPGTYNDLLLVVLRDDSDHVVIQRTYTVVDPEKRAQILASRSKLSYKRLPKSLTGE